MIAKDISTREERLVRREFRFFVLILGLPLFQDSRGLIDEWSPVRKFRVARAPHDNPRSLTKFRMTTHRMTALGGLLNRIQNKLWSFNWRPIGCVLFHGHLCERF
jgi:hypothetical protein